MTEFEQVILYIITFLFGTPILLCFTIWITTEFIYSIKKNLLDIKNIKRGNEKDE